MAKYKTPGVYIVEKNAFPNSAVAVDTAIPAFIGYTFKAERNGKSLIGVPTRIDSFAAYVESFGGAFNPKFKIEEDLASPPMASAFKVGASTLKIAYETNHELYFFNSIRLFYANGGGACIILTVDTYGDKADGLTVNAADFDKPDGPLAILKKEQEPTLIVMPDVVTLKEKAYPIYAAVLAHCAEMQSRFGIFDLKKHGTEESPAKVLAQFRTKIGDNFLSYGAAYYPWLNTSVVNDDEFTFENLPDTFAAYLEDEVPKSIHDTYTKAMAALAENTNKPKTNEPTDAALQDQLRGINKNYHLALQSASANYRTILSQARNLANQLPPSGAIAGVYAMVDNTRGVWKAPANCSLSFVDSPVIAVSSEMQEGFNIDLQTGKSVNVIRSFPDIGPLVWGARTLAGNSNDWKYINVRRTMIMIEQSIKLATRSYVFEANDANTWITVKSMITNFLINLWKQGALAGASPEQAFGVHIGLGATMTPTDILDGKMIVSVMVAIVKPAEFIVITFQQQMQQS